MFIDRMRALWASFVRTIPLSRAPLISYSIITAPRTPDYLPSTIKSLEVTGFFEDYDNLPLRIVGGSPDSSHLSRYSDRRKFLVDPMGEQEASDLLFPIAGLALRAVFGHRRALHHSRATVGSKYLLLMEDDIRFARGWQKRLRAILSDVEENFGDQFLLSLYRPGGDLEPVEAYRQGKFWVRYPDPKSCFYGVQAIVYPICVRDEYMFETSDHEKLISLPHDLSLGSNLPKMGIPILSTAPSLVQHMGVVSGAKSGNHTTGSFLEAV